LFLVGAMTVFAQSKTEKIKVYGSCGMCENRIEKAAKSVDSVTAAEWNKATKMLELTYDESKTNIHKVHMAIAKVGHDTDMHKATDEVKQQMKFMTIFRDAVNMNARKQNKKFDALQTNNVPLMKRFSAKPFFNLIP